MSLLFAADGTGITDAEIIRVNGLAERVFNADRQVGKMKIGQFTAADADQMIVPRCVVVAVWRSGPGETDKPPCRDQRVKIIINRGL